MKKLTSILFALVFLPSLAFASFDKDLYYGTKGSADVESLQEFLTEQGIYSGPISGNFFSLTLKSVKDFQTSKNIYATGYVGTLTRTALNEVLASKGISGGVTNESGDVINPPNTSPKTNDDVVAKLMEQINLLTSQLSQLQAQQTTLTNIQNQQIQNQQILGAIKENTTPVTPVVATSTPVSIPEIKKSLIITTNGGPSCGFVAFCTVVVVYLENGVQTNSSQVTITSDEVEGSFQTDSFNGVTGQSGNPASGFTRPSNSGPVAYFTYLHPTATATPKSVILTASTNGVSASTAINY